MLAVQILAVKVRCTSLFEHSFRGGIFRIFEHVSGTSQCRYQVFRSAARPHRGVPAGERRAYRGVAPGPE